MPRIHPTADVSAKAPIGDGTVLWHYAQIREDYIIGENVIIGRGNYVGNGVSVSLNSKFQNYELIYGPAVLEAGGFIGPGVILTNDEYPRAVNHDGSQKSGSDWNPVGVTIRKGASIGAGSICIAPIEIGAWALVAAGSTVTKSVPAFALMAGVPARRIRWVGKAGIPLTDGGAGRFSCPKSGAHYFECDDNTLEEVDV
jgi:acetyltransferase-like isoleucine patch superfamily enzyme